MAYSDVMSVPLYLYNERAAGRLTAFGCVFVGASLAQGLKKKCRNFSLLYFVES
jgi:hypothetical protein